MPQIGLYVTAACNWECRDCSQQPWMRDHRGWSLSLNDLSFVLDRIAAIGGYSGLVLTGGEPTQWPVLRDALVVIRDCRLFDRVVLNTNGTAPALLTRLREDNLIHGICPNTASRHLPIPSAPVAGTLPASCCCPRHTIMAGKVYICGNLYSTSRRLALAMTTGVCDLSDNWRDAFAGVDQFNQPQCAGCVGNRNVHRPGLVSREGCGGAP